MSHQSLLPLAALALSSAALSAQEVPGIQRVPTGGAPVFVHLDLDAGVYTLADTPFPGQSAALVSEFCYENSIDFDPDLDPAAPPPSALDALLFPATDELFDWGVKTCGGSGFVDRITIGYGSMAAPVIGGQLVLRVYQGALGFGFHGTPVAEITLFNLPSDGPLPPGGLLIPHLLTIDLGSQSFFLPDGPIGWSYENLDDQTAPLLVDVRIELGTQNFFDVYRPGPAVDDNLLGTFTLPAGGASNDPFENSFLIDIAENDVAGTAQTIPGTGNPSNFLSLGPPLVGAGWDVRLNLAAFPDVTMTFALVSRFRLSGVITPFGELIVDASRLLALSVETGSVHHFDIPTTPSALGRMFHAQGAFLSTSQGLRLTNGYELVVGSF